MLITHTTIDIHNLALDFQAAPQMDLCDASRALARSVGETLSDAHDLGVLVGEETITDSVALALARVGFAAAPSGDLRIFFTQLTKPEEHRYGADWEWIIGNGARWWHYLVQAKKLDVRKPVPCYPGLKLDDSQMKALA